MAARQLLIGGVCLATLAVVYAMTSQKPPPQASSQESAPKVSEIDGYRSWHLVNKEPVLIEPALSFLCAQIITKEPPSPHAMKYIRVYVNDIGKEAMLSEQPMVFPVGSIIIKEKFTKGADKKPELLTIMIKRAISTPASVQDWEFLTSTDQKQVAKGGDVSHCVSCHTGQPKTDFVYKTYVDEK